MLSDAVVSLSLSLGWKLLLAPGALTLNGVAVITLHALHTPFNLGEFLDQDFRAQMLSFTIVSLRHQQLMLSSRSFGFHVRPAIVRVVGHRMPSVPALLDLAAQNDTHLIQLCVNCDLRGSPFVPAGRANVIIAWCRRRPRGLQAPQPRL